MTEPTMAGDGHENNEVLSWPAPAKLNLLLRVTGRRDDGYHTLQTVFQLLDFGDTITLEKLATSEIRSARPIPGVESNHDLTLRAANLLKRATSTPFGALISVTKRLPMGAGLGGGSSNAATALCALNRLWETGLNERELARIGLELGADVPVFVRGFSAWAEGVGEDLSPIDLPERWYAVVNPSLQVSTADVFSDPALTRNCSAITIRAFLDGLINRPVDNVCQPVVFARYPEVEKAYRWLLERADTHVVGMSGTGSSVFAVFGSEGAARTALEHLPGNWSGFVARGINESPLRKLARMQ